MSESIDASVNQRFSSRFGMLLSVLGIALMISGAFVPFTAIILLVWWLSLSATVFVPDQWYNPFNPFSVMTCVLQWLLMLGIFILFNKKITQKMSQ